MSPSFLERQLKGGHSRGFLRLCCFPPDPMVEHAKMQICFLSNTSSQLGPGRLRVFWMTAEAVVSLGTAWSSHSPALLAFGGDSLIELLSAAVGFWRFRFTLNGHGQLGLRESFFSCWRDS